MSTIRHMAISIVSTTLCTFSIPTTILAATSHATSTGIGLPSTRTEDATWKWSDPTTKDLINWTVGANTVDSNVKAKVTGSEQKFQFTTDPKTGDTTISGKKFGSFSHTDTGKYDSTATGEGSGESTITKTRFGTTDSAKWFVTATGQLGTKKPGPWDWDSKITGVDPWTLSAADLAYLDPSSTLRFFFSTSFSGDYSAKGDIGFNASYETSTDFLTLLSIRLDASGAMVSSNALDNLTIYLLDSIEEGPTLIPAHIVTLTDIRNMLNGDIGPDNKLDAPLILGFLLDNLPIPTVDLGDGVVAAVGVGIDAHDLNRAGIPEPSNWVLLLAGFGLIGAALRRRGRSSVRHRHTRHASAFHP